MYYFRNLFAKVIIKILALEFYKGKILVRPGCPGYLKQGEIFMYKIGKVTYSQIHSLLPREANLVKIIDDRTFLDYSEALKYCRTLRISGDYTFVPVEMPEFGKRKTKKKRG